MAIEKVKLKGGKTRYRVRYREPGVKNPRTATFDTLREAKDFEAERRRAKRGEYTAHKASDQTLEAFGLEYMQMYGRVELSASTLAVYRSVWNRHILPRLGGYMLGTLAANPQLLQA